MIVSALQLQAKKRLKSGDPVLWIINYLWWPAEWSYQYHWRSEKEKDCWHLSINANRGGGQLPPTWEKTPDTSVLQPTINYIRNRGNNNVSYLKEND